MDFIKAFPSVTREDYMWRWTVPQIRLASSDNTHIVYLSEYQASMLKANNIDDDNIEALSDLGIPIFGLKK